MSLFVGYAKARSCTGAPTPGARALRDWAKATYRARDDGILNCRPVRGGGTLSLHAEGRAVDIGCRAGDPWAAALARVLVAFSAELGIQCVIFDQRIWSGAHPTSGWRRYGGVDLHTTHLHVELSWAGARSLTVARLKAVLSPRRAAVSRSVSRRPALRVPVKARPLPRWYGRPLREGMHGPDVQQMQRRLNHYRATRVGSADGVFGPRTTAAVRVAQKAHRLPADGVVGDLTARAIGS